MMELCWKNLTKIIGGDRPKTKMRLSNCTKNRQINNNTTFMNGKKSLKNCAKGTSSDEFSDSLGEGHTSRDRKVFVWELTFPTQKILSRYRRKECKENSGRYPEPNKRGCGVHPNDQKSNRPVYR